MNARGIPTGAYQVFHMLSSPWGRGYLPWPGWVGTLGYPHPDLSRGRYLGIGNPPPSGSGRGTTPPCEQTENIAFPHPLDAVGNKTNLHLDLVNSAEFRWDSKTLCIETGSMYIEDIF